MIGSASRRPTFGPNDPVSAAVRAALGEALSRVQRDEFAASRFEVEPVHRLRAACRRLRSVLRVFSPFLDDCWKTETGKELKWLAARLGAVRDLDVLDVRLHEAARAVRAPELVGLFRDLEDRRAAARAGLREALDSPRYRFLVNRIEEAVARPPLTTEARRPCRAALPACLDRAWTKLKRRGRQLRKTDPEEAFHRVRVLAKRARYAAEAIAPGLDKGPRAAAAALATRATKLQDQLGQLQDAVVAKRFLRHFQEASGEGKNALSPLLASLRQDARQARSGACCLWKKVE
jgi:CHAD domain-containing protein